MHACRSDQIQIKPINPTESCFMLILEDQSMWEDQWHWLFIIEVRYPPWETLHSRVRWETSQSVSQSESNQPKWKSHIPTAQSHPEGKQQQKAEKAPTTDDNQTQTEDTPTGRRKINGQTQQQEQDTGGRHEAQKNAGFISVAELLALVLLQLLIKPGETPLGDYIHPRRPRQVNNSDLLTQISQPSFLGVGEMETVPAPDRAEFEKEPSWFVFFLLCDISEMRLSKPKFGQNFKAWKILLWLSSGGLSSLLSVDFPKKMTGNQRWHTLGSFLAVGLRPHLNLFHPTRDERRPVWAFVFVWKVVLHKYTSILPCVYVTLVKRSVDLFFKLTLGRLEIQGLTTSTVLTRLVLVFLVFLEGPPPGFSSHLSAQNGRKSSRCVHNVESKETKLT